MTKPRKNIPVALLEIEHHWLTRFVMNHVIADDGAEPMPISDLYEEYCDFLARKELGPTHVNLLGFGRIFPKNFRRGAAYVERASGTLKCVFGVRVIR